MLTLAAAGDRRGLVALGQKISLSWAGNAYSSEKNTSALQDVLACPKPGLEQ